MANSVSQLWPFILVRDLTLDVMATIISEERARCKGKKASCIHE